MTPADKLLADAARRQFAALLAQPEAALDLTHAALLVAAEERPGLDVAHYRARLLALGLQARAHVQAQPAPERIAALNKFVFATLDFGGVSGNYYDPRNSLLSHVIDARRGLPITLALIYMELGRRAGLHVEGIGLPGHFIVRAAAGPAGAAGAGSVLVDVFHGRAVDEAAAQQLLDQLHDGRLRLSPAHLRPAQPREILVRLNANLKNVYTQGRRFERALAAVERILLVTPAARAERRDRGMLLARLGRNAAAQPELAAYLAAYPDATDAEQVRAALQRSRHRHAEMN